MQILPDKAWQTFWKKTYVVFCSAINNGVLFQVTLTAENVDLLKFMRLVHKIVTEIKQL